MMELTNRKRRLIVPSFGRRVKRQAVPAPNINQALKRAIMKTAETKESDTYATTQNAVGGYTIVLNQIAEGTDYTQRIGRHITPKGCNVDAYITLNSTVGLEDAGMVALVWDFQPNAGGATYANIFDTTSANPGQAFKFTGANADRFKILWIEHFVVQSSEATVNPGNFQNVKWRKYYDLKHLPRCEYNSTGSASPQTGALLLCFGSALNTGTAGSAALTYNARFTFTDL